MSLKELQERFPKWKISVTPGGVWVGRRSRPITLTNSRIDQGFRDCLIESSEDDLERELSKQEQVESDLSGIPNGK